MGNFPRLLVGTYQSLQQGKILLGGGLNDPKLPKTKKSKCYQTFLGAVLCIKAGENFEFGER